MFSGGGNTLASLARTYDGTRTTTVRRWTQAAVECYQRGCRCSGCFYNDFFAGSPQKCQMKHTVLELVRTIGRPNLDPVNMVIN